MQIKKLFTTVATAALVSILFVMTVSAHGHYRQTQNIDTSCPVCTAEDCVEKGRHTHDGKDYCGYNHADGYCDHSCETTSNKTASRHGRSGRQHHCH